MKRLLLLTAVLLGGCSAFHGKTQALTAQAKGAPPGQLVDSNGVPIERIAFRPGVSSVTVERMARGQQCSGGQGAGLVTEAGPVEVYRMQCDSGKVFMARCELRQCRQM
jgi:hypothetical protein